MPKNPKQPTNDDCEEYFNEYFKYNIPKALSEMDKLKKRLDKIDRAVNLFTAKFNKKPDIDEIHTEV